VALSSLEIDRILEAESHHDCAGVGEKKICVRIVAIAELPSRFGRFQIAAFWNNRDAKEHVAIMHGNVFGHEEVPTRIHSECLTGDAIGSLRCDCRDQLEVGLQRIAAQPCGLVLYLRQEGRGIGLINKLKAYNLQDQGADTVEANVKLGFKADLRDYGIGAQILLDLGVKKLRLMTNNPKKIEGLKHLYDLDVVERVPIEAGLSTHNKEYLEVKRDKMGHMLSLVGEPKK